MGKSPAKWIKTLLFSKKSGRSRSTKGKDASNAASDKGYVKGKESASAENSPVISEPVLVTSHSNETASTLAKGTPSSLGCDGVVPAISQDVDKQGIAGSDALEYREKMREEQAAIKAQAAFRGYLARRAFHALKGIIRLQALIRGQLVRRQAATTLCAMQAIVKLQALVRGRIVRRSGVSLEVSVKFWQQKDVNTLDTWKDTLSKNSFIYKLLSPPVGKPLLIQYDLGDANSVFIWLERWTLSRFWKPISQPKKIDTKSQTRRGSYAMETESGKSKCSVRRNPAVTVDPGQTNINSESEYPMETESGKSKCSVRRNPAVTVDPGQTSINSESEYPMETESGKSKHSVRRNPAVTVDPGQININSESEYPMETESGKSKCSVGRNPAMTVDPGQTNINSEPEKAKCSSRKVSSPPDGTIQEHPQTELEKVKRNLRKVSKSIVESSDNKEVGSEKPSNIVQTVAGSISVSPQQSKDDYLKTKKDATLTPDKSDLEASLEFVVAEGPTDTPTNMSPAVAEGQIDALTNASPTVAEGQIDALTNASSTVAEGQIDALTNASTGTELQPLRSTDNKENVLLVNSELCSKEERTSTEGHKTSRRRSSFSAKLENGENGLQNSPSIPSYMASTQSAKAKLRGQISPRLVSDSVEKNSFTRRHSLPSSTSVQLNSQSPRTQRHVQVSGRSGVKGDRSLTSSRDGNDRAIQVEWRR